MVKQKSISCVARNRKATSKIFPITCRGIKASEFMTREKYKWVNEVITDKRLPIKKHSPQSRLIQLVKFDRDVNSEEVLAEFNHRGLERPTYEDVFVFGDKYPREEMKRSVVFIHRPIKVIGIPFVLVLGKHGSGQDLDIGWLGHTWSQYWTFAAISK